MIPHSVEQLVALWASIDQELARRAAIKAGKARVHELAQAIVDAQDAGDPARPALEEDLRSLQRELQAEAGKLRALVEPPGPQRRSRAGLP